MAEGGAQDPALRVRRVRAARLKPTSIIDYLPS
jgi:hypothetical protein